MHTSRRVAESARTHTTAAKKRSAIVCVRSASVARVRLLEFAFDVWVMRSEALLRSYYPCSWSRAHFLPCAHTFTNTHAHTSHPHIVLM